MGTLHIVGIGPGAEDLVTPRARRVLEQAQAIVGYTLYVDLVRTWLPDAPFYSSPIGSEEERARRALALATELERVALLGSGDAGVYGLAGLAHELLEDYSAGAGPIPDIEVVPGVTAATAAAALLGAPLGHDFAAISLSDLLTPWQTIVRRLEAAASADFVIALYNPTSRARHPRFLEACSLLLRHRAGSTPIGIVTDASREGQQVLVTVLERLPSAGVGMLSTVIVGNSMTRIAGGRMVTPRGYAISRSTSRP